MHARTGIVGSMFATMDKATLIITLNAALQRTVYHNLLQPLPACNASHPHQVVMSHVSIITIIIIIISIIMITIFIIIIIVTITIVSIMINNIIIIIIRLSCHITSDQSCYISWLTCVCKVPPECASAHTPHQTGMSLKSNWNLPTMEFG